MFSPVSQLYNPKQLPTYSTPKQQSLVYITSILAAISTTTSTTTALSINPRNPNPIPAVAAKPTGGPASASIAIYSAYTCVSQETFPPPNISSQTVSVTEDGCAIVPIPVGAAISANMTATPKTGTAGCYIQAFFEDGCGLTLGNQYHGWPINGLGVGSKLGCANTNTPGRAYGAVQIVCV